MNAIIRVKSVLEIPILIVLNVGKQEETLITFQPI